MYIFRWLMTHPIITTWLLTAIVILLTIGGGGKDEHGEEHAQADGDHAVKTAEAVNAVEPEKVEEAAQSVAADTQEQEHTSAAPATAAVAVTATAVAAAAATTEEAKPTEDTAQTVSSTEALQPAEPVAAAAEQTAEAKVVEGEFPEPQQAEASQAAAPVDAQVVEVKLDEPAKAEAQQQVEAAQQAAPEAKATAQEPTAPAAMDSMSSEDLLVMAREAFWQDDKEKSASIYQMLIKRDPASLIYKGELGNVYWHQNKQEESAALYADIAVPMLKAGQTNEVANMLGFIGAFYPEKAREIHQIMSGK